MLRLEICYGGTYAFQWQTVAAQMRCIFCWGEESLTDEHLLPAFISGELIVKDGSCETCNREFGVAEAALKRASTPLFNLLQTRNRYGVVPNAPVSAEIRGMDMDGGEARTAPTVRSLGAGRSWALELTLARPGSPGRWCRS